MKHSCAKVFCSRSGERSGPVKKGDLTACINTRSLRTEPAPPHLPLMHPATYEGTALLPLRNSPLGSTAGRGAIVCGSNPTNIPVITFPGISYPGLPPNETDHASQSHAWIAPLESIPTCCSITHAEP